MPETGDARLAIDLLTLEYNALRTDILQRSSVRFSMLPFGVGLVTVAASLNSKRPPWPVVGCLVVFSLVVLWAWYGAGRSIGTISQRLSEIELQMNGYAGAEGERFLRWETDQIQRRGPLQQFLHRPEVLTPRD